jgi:hypothetical protein
MKVDTIKRYTARYYLVAVLPRNSNTSTIDERIEACKRNLGLQGYDQFVKNTNRYSSIERQPKYSEVNIIIEDREADITDDIVLLGTNVTVSWLYEK